MTSAFPSPADAPEEHWPAPVHEPSVPIDARVRVPGSKSLTNRYLLLAAIADGPSELTGALESRDSRLMMDALEPLGASFVHDGDRLRVLPLQRGPRVDADPMDAVRADADPVDAAPVSADPADAAPAGAAPVDIDTGLAGTVMRFVPPLVAALGVPARFDGDPHARRRPMGPVIEAVRQLGAEVDDEGRGALPFAVRPAASGSGRPQTPGGEGSPAPAVVEIDASGSSQFLSAVLLSGCLLPGGVRVRHRGESVPSLPHVRMTLEVLAEYGIRTEDHGDGSWTVLPGVPRAHDVVVEPDLSNAGPFVAAAVVTGGSVAIPDWPESTTQGGDHWREILPRFGAEVRRDGADLVVTGDPEAASALPGIDIDLSEAGELAPTVAAIAALASGPSRLTGIAHLRGHETDRLKALVTEIERLGGAARELPDGLEITRAVGTGGVFRTYDDHRMATAAAVIGLRVPGVEVENIATTAKTLPDFPEMWTRMLTGGGA
ncbi:3-phosphoshikimate 1-carboxyvinyltransferase [Rothia sp. AR01]|uniref:3-phosphoshikimate 1-carboxyvinyltransferase n=1 Tax=Rothia santali TaxID=2949643 RepID=A0A9X2HJA7_9MICC|nr:3-phosphoshikimate 1-carboxyvinyltransferase [Rothia santali]MCP3425928.1 3-phosphoshikimate 1-carboxyvinyltransferase [Rothia santali]